MITVQEMTARMKAEIVEDVKAGAVPATITGFADLHKYVDPNTYVGAEEFFGEVVTESKTDHEHQAKLDIVKAVMEPAREAVDAWIKAGGVKGALAKRITVWRPKTMIGLGSPVAYLGDDHPQQGDWHQSANAELIEVDAHFRLHQMGRNFLIYSMYHAREPYYLGLAVENFGAACRKLGYELPLKEADAVWLTYTKSEIEPAKADEQQLFLGHLATVFGKKAAQDQAEALGVTWPARVNHTGLNLRR